MDERALLQLVPRGLYISHCSKSHTLRGLQSWFEIPEFYSESRRSFDMSICHSMIGRDVLLLLSLADTNIVLPRAVIV